MPPVSDSPFTNPDNLRARYLTPRSVLLNLDESAAAGDAQAAADAAQVITDTGAGNIGGGSIGLGLPQTGCPAKTEFVWAKYGERAAALPAENLLQTETAHFLFNAVTGKFQKVIQANLITARCARIVAANGASQIVSLSHPVIQHFEDFFGTQVYDLLSDFDLPAGIVTGVDFEAIQSEIKSISLCGERECVHISLEGDTEGDKIYFSGTNPLRMMAGHNKPPGGGSLPGDIFE